GVARQSVAGDPLPRVARDLAKTARLICFDELHVTDIADAMILGRLFNELFAEPVVVVATSNVPPTELYKNGLNHALFLPFIALVEHNKQRGEFWAAKVFRFERLVGRQLFSPPADLQARSELDRLWSELTGKHPGAPAELTVKGRTVHVPIASMGVAR